MISLNNGFGYNLGIICRIESWIGVKVDVSKDFNLLQGQGHWVRGRGQIHDFFEKLVLVIT